MGMYMLIESCNRVIDVSWFDSLDEARSALASEYESSDAVTEGAICKYRNWAWASAWYYDCSWRITEVPVGDYLGKIFEEFRDKSGWKELDAESAVECFIRYIRERRTTDAQHPDKVHELLTERHALIGGFDL